MPTREEIREGIELIISNLIEGNKIRLNTDGMVDLCTTKLLSYLHSQGVVIKVDRKLPQLQELRARVKQWDGKDRGEPAVRGMYQERLWITEGAQQDMLNAGYVAVEPLI